jgi:glycogen(starch) synthase
LPFRLPEKSMKAKLSFHVTHRAIRRRMLEILKRHQIEMLHVQCVSSNAHYAGYAQRELKLPLVVTLQGELTMDASRIFQRSELARSVLRTALRDADVITACSRKTLRDGEEFFGQPFGDKGRVIFNAARVEEFGSAQPYQHARPYIFAIGRVVPQKGFDVLLRAYAAAEIRDHDLLIAGDGSELASLRQMARELGIEARVVFLGRAERERVPGLFAGCSFFVLPSTADEGLPVVCAEAMAAGKAVVATRSGGAPEAVLHEQNGFIVERGDVPGLATAMRKLCTERAHSLKMGNLGRQRSGNFSWSTVTSEYEAAYEAATAVHRGRRGVDFESKPAGQSVGV